MQTLAVILVRALGAYLVVVNLSTFAIMLSTHLSLERVSNVVVPLAPPLAFAAIGLLMIVWSRSLGVMLTRGLDAPARVELDAHKLLLVGTALLGLYFLASAASHIAGAVWDVIRQGASTSEAVVEMRRQRAVSSLIGGVTSAGVGVLLIWMSRAVFSREAASAA